MKKLITALLFIVASTVCLAQNGDMTGSWHGSADLGGSSIMMVFHINYQDGELTATMDLPGEGVKGIKADNVVLSGDEITIRVDMIGLNYNGKFDGENIAGGFTQAGFTIPLDLIKGEPAPPARPQEPLPPYTYRSEEVTIVNSEAGVTLAGTLTLPETGSGFPAVVMVTGSGPQDRNEEIMGHKPFLVIADHLTRNGIAVLRYDDRGTAESTGSFAGSTSEDFMYDALAAVDYLSERPEIAPDKIGVIGHSEGGTIAVMMAARRPDIGFIVSMAGGLVRGDSTLVMQNRDIMLSQNYPKTLADQYCAALSSLYRLLNDGISPQEVVTRIEGYDDLPEAFQNNLAIILGMDDPWFNYFIRYDPTADIAKIKCPVLAINGDKDLQVSAAPNLGNLAATLSSAGNERYTTRVYPGLNHLFQQSTTGAVTEYGLIEETIYPPVLEDIARWIMEITGGNNHRNP